MRSPDGGPLLPGFFLGLGTGENLNEHIVGQGWPETEVRQERLLEAVQVIRLLWAGGNVSHRGRYFNGGEGAPALAARHPACWPSVGLRAPP
jgi:alkanesulfonate monooxygenase SsuD/methylene tetrahydromethanopterin reductase-like flavin-dependent oxidoreductase (luciferase family)